MRPDGFFEDDDDIFGPSTTRRFRREFVAQLRRGPVEDSPDIEVAVALARLVHDDLEAFGTGGGQVLTEQDIREALIALRAIVQRVGIQDLDVPFRDYTSFKTYWLRSGARGSWQARRDLLSDIFDDLHESLSDLESKALASTLADPVSPRGRTGWAAIDAEIAELRRHFHSARSPQDYRNVGNDCVIVIEALSRQVYDPDRHLRPGEDEPPVGNTKQRLDRFVEDAVPGSDNAAARKLFRASIEMAQATKHRPTSTRRDAGLAADAVILVSNLLRRLDEPG